MWAEHAVLDWENQDSQSCLGYFSQNAMPQTQRVGEPGSSSGAKMHEPQTQRVNEPGSSSSDQGEDYLQYKPLLEAVDRGDMDHVKSFLLQNKDAERARISVTGMTALHAAAFAGHVKIVEVLVEKMSKQDLEIQETDGYTALSTAAAAGITQMAECMVKKNEKLVSIGIHENGIIPVALASSYSHKDIVRYLYKVTPLEQLTGEKETNGATLVVNCIIGRIFDVALHLLRRCPRLAYALDCNGYSAVSALVQIHSAFPSGSRLQYFWQRWIYKYGMLSWRSKLFGMITLLNKIYTYGLLSCLSKLFDGLLSWLSKLFDGLLSWLSKLFDGLLSWLSKLFDGLLSWLSKLFGIKQIYNTKLTHSQVDQLLHVMCEQISGLSEPQLVKARVYVAIFFAIKHGIVEFIIAIIKANPNILWSIDDSNGRRIFPSAVVHRQEKIFSLIYSLDAKKATLVGHTDKFNNNMLHLAGMLSSSTQFDHISGAALQMQRELQWYKEVESIVHPRCKELRNKDGLTPRELFSKNHEKLLKEAEKWMKKTASSCTVVTALIVTTMFAASSTPPGGNDRKTGLPLFLNKKLFTVFIVCDALSFFFSTTSLLIFLGILTSRYGEKDFLKSLPTKMILGLITLFISTATMMIAFSSALFLRLQGHLSGVSPPFIFLAAVPVTLFIFLQFPLLREIFMSTYGSSIFDRKTNISLVK